MSDYTGTVDVYKIEPAVGDYNILSWVSDSQCLLQLWSPLVDLQTETSRHACEQEHQICITSTDLGVEVSWDCLMAPWLVIVDGSPLRLGVAHLILHHLKMSVAGTVFNDTKHKNFLPQKALTLRSLL